MKKTMFAVTMFFIFNSLVFADKKADDLLAHVYAGLEAASLSGADMEINTTETAGKKVKKDTKKYAIKSGKKNKKINLQTREAPEPDFYPYCLFYLNDFIAGYDLRITQKDERIKLGKEEIVAIRKGQKADYPQIRIIIKDGDVLEIRFYSLTGKKYYEIMVKSYVVKKGVKIPSEINEKVITKNNSIEKRIIYSKF